MRGEPFGAPTTGWAWAQPHITEIVCAVGDVAHTLAQLRLEALDLPRATAAARAGLLASPWDQRLHADLMQVADAAGNPAGVKAIWNELLSRFDDEDQIRPDVATVYKRCRNRAERAT